MLHVFSGRGGTKGAVLALPADVAQTLAKGTMIFISLDTLTHGEMSTVRHGRANTLR